MLLEQAVCDGIVAEGVEFLSDSITRAVEVARTLIDAPAVVPEAHPPSTDY